MSRHFVVMNAWDYPCRPLPSGRAANSSMRSVEPRGTHKGAADLRRRPQPHHGRRWRLEDLNRVEESTYEHFEHLHRRMKVLLGDNGTATESPRADLLVESRSRLFQIAQRGQRG